MSPASTAAPTVHAADCAWDGSGAVVRGASLTQPEAVARRRKGYDRVVCGPDPFDNAKLARAIEAAVGACKPDGPHADVAGALAQPHFQHSAAAPGGHSFYESPTRKAVSTP